MLSRRCCREGRLGHRAGRRPQALGAALQLWPRRAWGPGSSLPFGPQAPESTRTWWCGLWAAGQPHLLADPWRINRPGLQPAPGETKLTGCFFRNLLLRRSTAASNARAFCCRALHQSPPPSCGGSRGAGGASSPPLAATARLALAQRGPIGPAEAPGRLLARAAAMRLPCGGVGRGGFSWFVGPGRGRWVHMWSWCMNAPCRVTCALRPARLLAPCRERRLLFCRLLALDAIHARLLLWACDAAAGEVTHDTSVYAMLVANGGAATQPFGAGLLVQKRAARTIHAPGTRGRAALEPNTDSFESVADGVADMPYLQSLNPRAWAGVHALCAPLIAQVSACLN
jgi:hypothetical protein